jgi:hypothetical protein
MNKTKTTIVSFLIAATVASANFIDPANPTDEDRVNEDALLVGGCLALNLYYRYYHGGFSSDDLNGRIWYDACVYQPHNMSLRKQMAVMTKIYFRRILEEMARNRHMATTPEEKDAVYFKTKDWLEARTGRKLPAKYDQEKRVD